MTGTVNELREIRTMKKLHKITFIVIPFFSCAAGLIALKKVFDGEFGETVALGAGIFGVILLILCAFILIGFRLRGHILFPPEYNVKKGQEDKT